MIVLPEHSRDLRILGIDPGTTTMGMAVLDWPLPTDTFTVEYAYTLVANDNHPHYRAMADLHGNRTARLQQQADTLREILHLYQPHVVVAESPFMGRFAQSYGALMECVQVIRGVLLDYDFQIPLRLVDPPSVKKGVGVKLGRKTDKEDVRRALAARTDLTWKVALETLDEHSVDAIAVGLHYPLHIA